MPSPDPDTPPPDALADLEALFRRAVREELAAARDRPSIGEPPLYDLAGAAARLNVSERTVESLVATGEIPVVRIGTGRGVRRFEPSALQAFIRRNARTL
ncbi:helix-turn-helix domain-containing protein [Rubrivirga sp. SAORIC476]|uniref:helix-turn-helix domain-containing protein n=1 Tax=Rubrivirga sp. SAORIC476 TaxID=1961794 RepID=UPI001303F93B|nr:helix-turn-helix domain-containing protein [Rubrivirga sp. SAORIC476]